MNFKTAKSFVSGCEAIRNLQLFIKSDRKIIKSLYENLKELRVERQASLKDHIQLVDDSYADAIKRQREQIKKTEARLRTHKYEIRDLQRGLAVCTGVSLPVGSKFTKL